jgi:preprotein translocase subunit SecA
MRPMPPTQLAAARRHAQVLVVLHEEPDRTFLHVVYTTDSKIELIEWAQLKVTDIDVADRQSLLNEAETVRLTRLAKAGIKDIGRNDQCPCGSGRKYKKCCLSR